jgi:opacity protein-like surface antigen
MKKMLLAAAMAASVSGAPAAADIQYQLRAVVQPYCEVQSMQVADFQTLSAIEVTTRCNMESFRLEVLSGSQGLEIVQAASSQASLRSAGSGQLSVRLRSPGAQTFTIQLAHPLEHGEQVNLRLMPV